MRKRSFTILLTLALLILQLTIANSLEITEGASTQGEIKLSGDERVVCLLVASNVYEPLKPYLERWMEDVRKEGYEPTLKVITNETPQQIRQMLRETPNLEGCLMVGDIPYVLYETTYEYPKGVSHHEVFPTDLYYMDLDGQWVDIDGNGIFNTHGGNIYPEIWVGRLKTSTLSEGEIKLLKNYFNKNHLYRTGAFTLPHRALIYTDHYCNYYTYILTPKTAYALQFIYNEVATVTYPQVTNADDYLNRLNEGWSLVRLLVHSGGFGHYFGNQTDGKIYPTDIKNANPKAFFYIITSCGNFDYRRGDYIGGWYVFTKYGLLAIGDSGVHDLFVVLPETFFLQLRYRCFGLAYLRYARECIKQNARVDSIYNGIIIGDPLLRPVYNGVDGDGDCLADWFELENGLDPGNPDSDGDGLTDYEELIFYETNPLKLDSDEDGLSDGEETRLDGNPLDPDTDDDGLTDGEECRLGTGINTSDSDFDGLLDGEEVEVGTDPLNGDTDGDELCDEREIELGTNPLSKDTDRDYWNDYVDPDPLNALIPNVILTSMAVIIGLTAVASKISRTPRRERG